MSVRPSSTLPFAVSDDLIDEAASVLDVSGRLVGSNSLLLMDVAAPKGAFDPAILFLAQAAVGLHREIQDDDELSDIEEALEDPLRANDQHGIDEACDRYRALLASRLSAVARAPEGDERLIALRTLGLSRQQA